MISVTFIISYVIYWNISYNITPFLAIIIFNKNIDLNEDFETLKNFPIKNKSKKKFRRYLLQFLKFN